MVWLWPDFFLDQKASPNGQSCNGETGLDDLVAGKKKVRSLMTFSESCSRLEPALRVINPGPFGIKEHVIATMLGTSGTNGSAATDVFVTMKLFYRVHVTPLMAIFGIFSISVMGIGMVGILRPLIVYPSEAVYYYTLPMVSAAILCVPSSLPTDHLANLI